MRDDRVDAGLNATLDTGSQDLFAIFVPGPTTPGTQVITKLDVAHKAPRCLQSLLAFMPKASQMKLRRKYNQTCRVVSPNLNIVSRSDSRY